MGLDLPVFFSILKYLNLYTLANAADRGSLTGLDLTPFVDNSFLTIFITIILIVDYQRDTPHKPCAI